MNDSNTPDNESRQPESLPENVSGSLNNVQATNNNDSGDVAGSFFAICISLIALCLGVYMMFFKTSGTHGNIAVADTDLIINAYFIKHSNNINNIEALNDLKKINAYIDEQARNGVLVVKANAVLGLPESVDITSVLAQQLGLSESDLSLSLNSKKQQSQIPENQQSQNMNQSSVNQNNDELNSLGLGSSLD